MVRDSYNTIVITDHLLATTLASLHIRNIFTLAMSHMSVVDTMVHVHRVLKINCSQVKLD